MVRFIREINLRILSNEYKLQSFKCVIISVPLHVDKNKWLRKKV